MSDDEMATPELHTAAPRATQGDTAQTGTKPGDPAADPAKASARTSRLARLKRKIQKIQGKDPDIYPMW